MRGQLEAKLIQMADPARNVVKIADLTGPAVESHPWDKMLAAQQIAGNKPDIGELELSVPADQYYIVFRSLSKLLDGIDAGDLWGTHLFSQAAKTAKDQRTSDRLKTQLAMQTDPLTRPFYDMVVDEVAITGSDLYMREGSDVTMLFKIKQPEVFQVRMNGFMEAAEKSRSDAVRSTGQDRRSGICFGDNARSRNQCLFRLSQAEFTPQEQFEGIFGTGVKSHFRR